MQPLHAVTLLICMLYCYLYISYLYVSYNVTCMYVLYKYGFQYCSSHVCCSQLSSVTCVSFCTIEASWLFPVHFIMSLGGVLF